MTKEQLNLILAYSETHHVPEKEACRILTGQNGKTLFYYKKKYGISPNPVGNATFTARKLRKYQVNDAYFTNLTLENCYYAGFIAADGCIIKNQLVIGLSGIDRPWLEAFKGALKAESPIKDRVHKKEYHQCYLNVTSETICKDLSNHFNIHPRKSLNYIPPTNLTNEQKDSFIIGLIDGDGSICLSNSKKTQPRLSISIVGTKDTCMFVKNRFEEILQEKTPQLHQRSLNKNFYSYYISDRKARYVFTYLYTNYVLPRLERKWLTSLYMYCQQYKKANPVCKRKGVNVYNLNGELLYTCKTLSEAAKLTGIPEGRISHLCKLDDSNHRSGSYMFSRSNKSKLDAYICHKNSNKVKIEY